MYYEQGVFFPRDWEEGPYESDDHILTRNLPFPSHGLGML